MAIDISIIVPIYNGENYLNRCVDSILQQSFKNFEIILIDDGSTDSSGEIADQYAKQDPRISVIHKDNGGLVNARKTGIMKARGRYVTYVDCDDFLDIDTYCKMYKWIQETEADVVICGFTRDDGKGNQYSKINAIDTDVYTGDSLSYFYEHMLSFGDFYTPGVFPSLCLKLFRKEILLGSQLAVPEDITIGEDVAGSYPALLKANCIVVDNDICGYHYCLTEGSMTQSYEKDCFQRVSKLYDYLRNLFCELKIESLNEQLEDYRLHLIRRCIYGVRSWGIMSLVEKKEYLRRIIKQASIFNDIDKVDMSRVPRIDRMRVTWIYNEKWLMLMALYYAEKWKHRIYCLFSEARKQLK